MKIKIRIPFVGAAISAFWVALAGALPAAIFWNLNYKGAFQIYFVFAVVALFYMLLRAKTYGIFLENGFLTVRRGLLIITRRTFPLNHITALRTLQTPAQRATRTCFLLLHSASGSVLIAGLSTEDVKRIESAVQAEKGRENG